MPTLLIKRHHHNLHHCHYLFNTSPLMATTSANTTLPRPTVPPLYSSHLTSQPPTPPLPFKERVTQQPYIIFLLQENFEWSFNDSNFLYFKPGKFKWYWLIHLILRLTYRWLVICSHFQFNANFSCWYFLKVSQQLHYYSSHITHIMQRIFVTIIKAIHREHFSKGKPFPYQGRFGGILWYNS